MSLIPADLKYVDTHEWVRREADGTLTIGITDHAQAALGDVVFVELPAVGKVFSRGEQAGVVESVKAASDVYAPLAGTVLAVNEQIESSPELINEEPYAGGWFYRLQPTDAAEADSLLDAAGYSAEIGE